MTRNPSAVSSFRGPLISGMVVSVGVRVAGMGLSYAANVLISRTIGLHGFGLYVVALGWALVLVFPARIGFDNSPLRYVTIYLENGDAARLRGFILAAAGAVTAASIVAGAAMLGVAVATSGDGERSVAIWAAVLIPPLALLGIFSPMMRSARRIFASQFYDQMLRPLFVIVGLELVVSTGFAPTAGTAMMVTALAAFGALFCLLLHFQRVFSPAIESHTDFAAWRQWFALSLPLFAMSAAQELMNQMEVILLGALAGARQAGLFAACWRLASLVPFVLVGLTTVGGPMIVSAAHRNDGGELHRITKLIARLGFAFALASTLLLVIAGKWLLGLFGPEFPAAYPILLILLVGGIVNAFTGIVAYLLALTGRERPALIIFSGALLVSGGLNLVLIPQFGAVGAAIASGSALSAWNLAMLFYVRRTMGIDASAIARPPRKMVLGG